MTPALIWLGPASRSPTFVVVNDVHSPRGLGYPITELVFAVSPDGRSIAFIDLGPDTAGNEAPEIFLLDLRSGRRTQLTQLSRVASGGDLRFPSFLDSRTIGFYSGFSASTGTNAPLKADLVKTDGTGLHEVIGAPTAVPGARIVAHFGITSARQQILLVRMQIGATKGVFAKVDRFPPSRTFAECSPAPAP